VLGAGEEAGAESKALLTDRAPALRSQTRSWSFVFISSWLFMFIPSSDAVAGWSCPFRVSKEIRVGLHSLASFLAFISLITTFPLRRRPFEEATINLSGRWVPETFE
jgi:hypothetical protein